LVYRAGRCEQADATEGKGCVVSERAVEFQGRAFSLNGVSLPGASPDARAAASEDTTDFTLIPRIRHRISFLLPQDSVIFGNPAKELKRQNSYSVVSPSRLISVCADRRAASRAQEPGLSFCSSAVSQGSEKEPDSDVEDAALTRGGIGTASAPRVLFQ